MSLLDTLKSLLGLESSGRPRHRREDVEVTVEHEPDATEPSARSEHEVKGTDEATGTTDGPATPTSPSADESAAAEDAGSGDDAAAGSTASTEEIKGIGPAYSSSLADAGVETVGDLAEANAAALAERTDLSESRLTEWIERAKAH